MVENFGFIHEKIDIKLLILFVMQRLPKPVTLDVLTELAMSDEGISYFDVTECIAMLVKTDHLQHEDGKYTLTAKGQRNGEALERNLPYTVRTKAEEAAAIVRAAQNRDAMIKTYSKIDESGSYRVTLSLSDGVGDIISMELFAANEKQASSLEKGFRKNAEKVYHAIIDMIMK